MVVKRLGLSYTEFDGCVEKARVKSSVGDSPYGYYHGLFAKIADDSDVGYINDILEKIKQKKTEK